MHKIPGICSFNPTKLFLPMYEGSENMPLLPDFANKKRALGEKANCMWAMQLFSLDMTFLSFSCKLSEKMDGTKRTGELISLFIFNIEMVR